MLASAVSICGVSAAIATAGAIKGDPKKLSYVISLVLVTAIPMMLFMPPLAASLGLSPEVTGAWIGGTIDTTGAVVAAGTLAGDVALKTSTIVKFSQNVLSDGRKTISQDSLGALSQICSGICGSLTSIFICCESGCHWHC